MIEAAIESCLFLKKCWITCKYILTGKFTQKPSKYKAAASDPDRKKHKLNKSWGHACHGNSNLHQTENSHVDFTPFNPDSVFSEHGCSETHHPPPPEYMQPVLGQPLEMRPCLIVHPTRTTHQSLFLPVSGEQHSRRQQRQRLMVSSLCKKSVRLFIY